MRNATDWVYSTRRVQSNEASDPYETEVYRWWHLSRPSPELLSAVAEGWFAPPDQVLDLGCGLATELAFLRERGFSTVGIDLSPAALGRAQALHPNNYFVQGDVLNLPFPPGSFDVLIDRGCFHYMPIRERSRYEQEARRVLRGGGRLLLRACLYAAGVETHIEVGMLRQMFWDWHVVRLTQEKIPSDSRLMEALVARLVRP